MHTKLRHLALVTSTVVLVACGGGGGGSTPAPANHPPTVSQLSYTPTTAYQATGGSVNISGTLNFADEDGDVTTLRVTTSAGADLTVPLPTAAGIRNGTGTGVFSVSVDQVGSYSFQVWVVDAAGNASNRLSGSLAVQPDDRAVSWRTVYSPASLPLGAVQAGSTLLAVGTGGSVLRNAGSGWTEAGAVAGVTHALRSVAWSGSLFVAVGDDGLGGTASILSSPDGVAWTVRQQRSGCAPNPCRPANRLNKVVWAGTQFVAVGSDSQGPAGSEDYVLVLTSPDGVTWTQQAAQAPALLVGGGAGMVSLAWSGSMLVGVGEGPQGGAGTWRSADARSWTFTPVPALGGSFVLRDVAWGHGRFVAVGFGGRPAVASSADGLTWQTNNDGVTLPPMNAIASGPSGYLAVSNTARQVSTDALLWTGLTGSAGGCGNAVLWDGLHWVGFGAGAGLQNAVCMSP